MFPHNNNDQRSTSQAQPWYNAQARPFQPVSRPQSQRHVSHDELRNVLLYNAQSGTPTREHTPGSAHHRRETLNPTAAAFQFPTVDVQPYSPSPHTPQPEDIERSSLGHGRSFREAPPHLATPVRPLQMARAKTLDSPVRTSLSPSSQSHQSLPITRSPQLVSAYILPTPRQSLSPLSAVSAPGDRRDSLVGRSVSSPTPCSEGARSSSVLTRPQRGPSGRIGGPPKAVLGGPGGKTFDEMLIERSPRSVSGLSPTSDRSPSTSHPHISGTETPSRQPSSEIEVKVGGKAIPVRLPPASYSPPDSPVRPSIPSEIEEVGAPSPKLPRKSAYPWPAKEVIVSPTGLPLPLSPETEVTETGHRRDGAGPSATDSATQGVLPWKDKEVIVAFPDADGWEKLQPPPRAKEEEHENLGGQPPVAEGQYDTPNAKSGSSSTAWADMPVSPPNPIPTPAKTDPSPEKNTDVNLGSDRDASPPKPQHKASTTGSDLDLGLAAHPSLPPKPITREKALATSAPTRRVSAMDLGNSAFLKRQLGGVLRGPGSAENRISGNSDLASSEEGKTGGRNPKSHSSTKGRTPEDDVFVDIPLSATRPEDDLHEDPLLHSKLRAWDDEDEYDGVVNDYKDQRSVRDSPAGGQSMTEEQEDVPKAPQVVNERSANLEEMRQKALASKRRKRGEEPDAEDAKRSAEDETPNVSESKYPGLASLEEACQKALDPRRSRFNPFLQRQLGGLFRQSTESTELSTDAKEAAVTIEEAKQDRMKQPSGAAPPLEGSAQVPAPSEDSQSVRSNTTATKSTSSHVKEAEAPFEISILERERPASPPTYSQSDSTAPTNPPAKRLRPTAEAWRPRSSSSVVPSTKESSHPFLQPTAKPFIPRQVSDPAGKRLNALSAQLRPTAATFVPPSKPDGFTFTFPRPAADRFGTFGRRDSVVSNTSSEGQKLRPTAAPFVPIFGQKGDAGGQPSTLRLPMTSSAHPPHLGVRQNDRAIPALISQLPSAPPPKGDQLSAIILRHPENHAQSKPEVLSVPSVPQLSPLSVVSLPHPEEEESRPLNQAVPDQMSDLFSRPSSSAEQIMDHAELGPRHVDSVQPRSSDDDQEGVQVEVSTSTRHRGRAETITFGPLRKEHDGQSDPVTSTAEGKRGRDGGSSDYERVGLFFQDPMSSASDQDVAPLRGEASPRPSMLVLNLTSDRPNQTPPPAQERDDRPTPRSRPPSLRSEHHSYHPRPLPVLSGEESPEHSLNQVTIHPSHPFHWHHTAPATPTRHTGAVVRGDDPDVPHSANTHSNTHQTSDSGVSSQEQPFVLDSSSPNELNNRSPLPRPLPVIPQTARGSTDDNQPLHTAQPITGLEDPFTTPVKAQPVPETDTHSPHSAAHLASTPRMSNEAYDDPQSASLALITPKAIRRLPDLPMYAQARHVSTPGRSAPPTAPPLHREESWAESLERRVESFARSAAPSPEFEPEPTSHSITREGDGDGEREEEAPAAKEKKFREWVFPLLSHDLPRRPLSRRHTMSLSFASPMDSEAERSGTFGEIPSSAESFAGRVHDLREYLRPISPAGVAGDVDGDVPRDRVSATETGTSSEFPLSFKAGGRAQPLGPRPDAETVDYGNLHEGRQEKWDMIVRLLEGLGRRDGEVIAGLKELKDALGGSQAARVRASQDEPANDTGALERVTTILEEHSRLLSSLHDTASNIAQSQTTQHNHSHILAGKEDVQPLTPDFGPSDEPVQSPRDLFAAILTGQHAILEKFDEVASNRLSGMAELHEAIDALQQLEEDAQDRLDQTRQAQSQAHARTKSYEREPSTSQMQTQLADALVENAKTKAERKSLLKQVSQLEGQMEAQDRQMEKRAEEVKQMRKEREEGRHQVDVVLARTMAAELERDALGRAFGEGKEREQSLREELKAARNELMSEQERSRQAEQRHEARLATLQAEAEAEASKRAAIADATAQAQADAARQAEKEATAAAAAAAAAQTTQETLAALNVSALNFQEEVISRMIKLDDAMHESMGSRVKEYEGVLDRNRLLQGEVDGLRERLETSADKFARLQLSTATTLSQTTAEQKSLEERFEAEQTQRLNAEEKMRELMEELETLKGDKGKLEMVASERALAARMAEIRLQALAQETIYWRQFALDYDRRQFRKFMDTQPFRLGQEGDGKPIAPMATSAFHTHKPRDRDADDGEAVEDSAEQENQQRFRAEHQGEARNDVELQTSEQQKEHEYGIGDEEGVRGRVREGEGGRIERIATPIESGLERDGRAKSEGGGGWWGVVE